MNDAEQTSTGQSRRDGVTPRALTIGIALAAAVAVITPINSLLFKNGMLFGSYLPVVSVVVAAAISLGLNPLLGSRRLGRGEQLVVLILITSLGGVVGQGLVRFLPGIMVGPATTLPTMADEDQLMGPAIGDGERAAELAARILARFDRDGDGVIAGAERRAMGPCLGDDERLDADGLAAALRRPTEAYAFPTWIAVGVPDRGRVDPGDPAHQHLVGSYQDGVDSVREDGRVGYGDRVSLSALSGDVSWWVLTGAERDAALAAGRGVADPTTSRAAGDLRRAEVGAAVAWAGATYAVTAIDPAGMPLAPWWSALLAWSPLLLGAIAAMVAVAGVVRHQWIANERLPFPIATVLASLTDAPREGIWRSRGLWVAAGVVLFVQLWRSAYAAGWVPIDISLSISLLPVIPGDSWIANTPQLGQVASFNVFFTLVAMAFLISTEVGFSLWASFIGVNLIVGLLMTTGVDIGGGDIRHGIVGATGVFALVVLWLGRHHYLAVLRAAVGRDDDPAARAAAPYIWLLLAGCGLMLAFMLAAGVPLSASTFVILALLTGALVLARCVAEAGVPYTNFDRAGRIGEMSMLWFGAAVPTGALVPLAMIGFLFGGGDRERLMTHALNAQAMGERRGLGIHRISAMVGGAGIIGIVGAFGGLLIAAAIGGALAGDGYPASVWRDATRSVSASLGEHGQSIADHQQGHAGGAYAIGGALMAALCLTRLRFPGFKLHPIGFILMAGWQSVLCWFSYFLGWLIKVLVLRYGGTRVYRHLVPVAIGLILGDAVAIVILMGVRIIAWASNHEIPAIRILPN